MVSWNGGVSRVMDVVSYCKKGVRGCGQLGVVGYPKEV